MRYCDRCSARLRAGEGVTYFITCHARQVLEESQQDYCGGCDPMYHKREGSHELFDRETSEDRLPHLPPSPFSVGVNARIEALEKSLAPLEEMAGELLEHVEEEEAHFTQLDEDELDNRLGELILRFAELPNDQKDELPELWRTTGADHWAFDTIVRLGGLTKAAEKLTPDVPSEQVGALVSIATVFGLLPSSPEFAASIC